MCLWADEDCVSVRPCARGMTRMGLPFYNLRMFCCAIEDVYRGDDAVRTMFSCDCGFVRFCTVFLMCFVRCFYETEDGLDFVRGNCCVQRTDSVRPCHNC
jgi:hypothetical protein